MPNPLHTYIWFGLVGFYGIPTIIGYLMPYPLIHMICKYILLRSQRSFSQLNGLEYCNVSKSKVGDCSRGQPEGSIFNSYYTEM